MPPVWQEGGNMQLSCSVPTPVGRDILSRLIYGARYSLFIGLVVADAVADSSAS
jgi:dipeptide transport system permease protein